MSLPERVEICDVLCARPRRLTSGKEYVALAAALDRAGVAVIQFLRPKPVAIKTKPLEFSVSSVN